MEPFAPSHPVTHTMSSSSWHHWWQLRAQRWLPLPQGGTGGITLPPEDLASGERQGLRSRCNEWPAEVDWNGSPVEDCFHTVFAPSYLVLACPLILWAWEPSIHSALLRPLDHSPRPKALPGCCHSDPFMNTFRGTSRASVLFTILVRGNVEG